MAHARAQQNGTIADIAICWLPTKISLVGIGMVENGATTIWELWNGNTANPCR